MIDGITRYPKEEKHRERKKDVRIEYAWFGRQVYSSPVKLKKQKEAFEQLPVSFEQLHR